MNRELRIVKPESVFHYSPFTIHYSGLVFDEATVIRYRKLAQAADRPEVRQFFEELAKWKERGMHLTQVAAVSERFATCCSTAARIASCEAQILPHSSAEPTRRGSPKYPRIWRLSYGANQRLRIHQGVYSLHLLHARLEATTRTRARPFFLTT